MPAGDFPAVYRIERHEPDILQLFRGETLLDRDIEGDGDSLADIVRWGSGVAWAEDYTAVARWDARPDGESWEVLVGVVSGTSPPAPQQVQAGLPDEPARP